MPNAKFLREFPPKAMSITWEALREIINKLGRQPAETGALLCGPEDSDVISQTHFDANSRNTGASYTPAVATLNALLKKINAEGLRMKGFVHSHPPGIVRPSGADEIYAHRILTNIPDMPWMWMPIVISAGDTGVFELRAYVAERDGANRVRVSQRDICALNLPEADALSIGGVHVLNALSENTDRRFTMLSLGRKIHTLPSDRSTLNSTTTCTAAASYANVSNMLVKNDTTTTSHTKIGNTFDRVQSAYDLPRLRRCRVIVVGTGGSASFVEDSARSGIGQWVLIDPDTISETNIATQQAYRRDIGRAKVDALSERIRDINPDAATLGLKVRLDDLSDERMQELAFGSLEGRTPEHTVICGLTDSFNAQARTNRLALKLGIPSLCAQMYREGRGGELTFTYPGITAACHRCILSSRYDYFVNKKLSNDVTSHGSPIFSAMRLNALAGWVLLALLHHGSSHSRWGSLLQRIGKRNFVRLRMDPDLSKTMGITAFDKASAGQACYLFDDVLWQEQEAEAPPATGYHCLDCGGTGDLRNVQRDAQVRTANTQTLPLSQPLFVPKQQQRPATR
ncbi:hypothetical protein AGMMS50256_17470 [Betaproteobacteria bacterium]|nr:hypothetical protein AGMMS50256_17470 [Betaproteobacteria bacterium]